MRYDGRMTNADVSRDMQQAASPRPMLLIAIAGVVVLGAALLLWARFGEGVYGQMLLNAVIACF